jgi:DNA modification methylase
METTKKPDNYNLFGELIVEDVLLRDKFLEPPFSVLDSKTGSWQNRKRQWKELGIQSEVGRDAECVPSTFGEIDEATGLNKYGRKPMSGTSIFDPALTELMYHWFCPVKGHILDPFAGGSVRGIVATRLGFNYTGIDIRQEQIDSNYEQALKIVPDNTPKWICGDSDEELDKLSNNSYDFIFSCPPYLDLEVYSELENDLSTMTPTVFEGKLGSIVNKCYLKLRDDRFACFVVGDVRDDDGFYVNFVDMVKRTFIKAGFKFYNDAILLQPLGTAMLRANNTFTYRKLVKTHENVLVFYKGDVLKIKDNFEIIK